MTERAIICARIAELKQMLDDLQASLRRLEIEKAMAGLHRATDEAKQLNRSRQSPASPAQIGRGVRRSERPAIPRGLLKRNLPHDYEENPPRRYR